MRLGLFLRLSVLALGALASVATSPPLQPPEPDSCDDPTDATAQTLAVGSGLAQVFTPWQDGDSVGVTLGDQGGSMIAVKLRVEGQGSFACVAQRIEILEGSTSLGVIDVPLHFYEVDGGWETQTNWVVLSEAPEIGATVTVNAAVGGQTVSVDLIVGGEDGTVLSIDPPTVTASVGETVRFTVAIRPPAFASIPLILQISSSDPNAARPLSDTLQLPSNTTEATFGVVADGPGLATIEARIGVSSVTAAMTVEEQPMSITPASLTVAAGGSAIVTLRANEALLASDRTVTLTAGAAMAAPASVTFPAGVQGVHVRVYGFTGTAGFVSTLDATHASGASAHADVSLTDGGPAPSPGDLQVTEVAFDVGVDANCDGSSGGPDDQFVELVNLTTGPRQLQDVTVGTATLPPFVLGSGETLVVFGEPLGSSSGRPWCENLTATHIGDAAGLSAGALGLQGGSAVELRRAGTLLSSDLLPASAGVSLERGAAGTFIPHTLFPNAASDRVVTPGTLPDARPFADF